MKIKAGQIWVGTKGRRIRIVATGKEHEKYGVLVSLLYEDGSLNYYSEVAIRTGVLSDESAFKQFYDEVCKR